MFLLKHTRSSHISNAVLLILPRLFAFFCCDAPYSLAYAAGMLLAVIPQAGAVLLLTAKRQTVSFPPLLLRACRIYALCYAAALTVQFRSLCHGLLLPHCGLMLLLLLLMLLYTVRQPLRAAERAAMLLLFAGSAAVLLLPAGGFHALRGISLFAPDSITAGFFRELAYSGELPLIPLLMQNRPAAGVRKSLTVWAAVRGVLLPLTVLFGAMQNGRLLRWAGNPFFLLLARAPLSDAIRTDGFWMLYAFACGGLSITACLRTALPQRGRHPMLRLFLPYCAVFALLTLYSPALTVLQGAAIMLGLVLPLCCTLLPNQRRCPA